MFVRGNEGTTCIPGKTPQEEQTRTEKCSEIVLTRIEGEQAKANNSLRSISFQTVNELTAAWASFLSRLLIERTFFQNTDIPRETLLYLANDLMAALVPQETETLNVKKEMVIMWKQLRGQELTQEEEAYDNSPKEINVVGEILNGITLSTTALIGQNMFRSIQSAIAEGFWNHVPAIIGYSGTALFGAQGIAYAVDKLLGRSSLSKDQKEGIRPWLNMVGRLALGFAPKVQATEAGVHYHYPSTAGSTQTFSKGQVATLRGDSLEIEKEGVLITSKGKYEGVYSADFKLRKVYEINEERIRIQVVDQEGKAVPVEFKRVQGEHGSGIQVICDDQQMAEHWKQLINPKMAVQGQISDGDASSCSTSLALGTLSALTVQNAIPLAIGAMSCLQRVHAGATDHASNNFVENGFIVESQPVDLAEPSRYLLRNYYYGQDGMLHVEPVEGHNFDSAYAAANNAMGTNFLTGLEGSSKVSLLLSSAASHLASQNHVFKALINLADRASLMYNRQSQLNRRFQSAAASYINKAQQQLEDSIEILHSIEAEPLKLISQKMKVDASGVLDLCNTMYQYLQPFLEEVKSLENDVAAEIETITKDLAKHSSGLKKENLEQASKALASSLASLQQLKGNIERKSKLLDDKKQSIRQRLNPQPSENSGGLQAEAITWQDLAHYFNQLTARIFGLRLMHDLTVKQNNELKDVYNKGQTLKIKMVKDVEDGTFHAEATGHDFDRLISDTEKNGHLNIQNLMTGPGQTPKAEQSNKNDEL